MKRIATALAATLAIAAVVPAAIAATVSPVGADDEPWDAVIPGEYLLALKPDGDPAAIAASLGSAPLEQLVAGSDVYRVLLDPMADPDATIQLLTNTPGVDLAQPNVLTESTDVLGLRRRFFTDLAPAVTTSAAGYRLDQVALGSAGLAAGPSAPGVVVAVLDTGLDTAHPALAGRVAAGGYDFVDDDPLPLDEGNGLDDDGDGAIDEAVGHGTYVAGLVGLVAPGARLLPIRVLDSDGRGSTWTMMQGLALAAARRSRVVNLSFGGGSGGEIVERQLDRLEEIGVIVVAAAGNDASDVATYPAAIDTVVGVTSIDGRSGAAATFANRGSWVDVAAPGVAIASTFPGGRYAVWGGTSASAPIVAGLVALVAHRMPGAAADDVVAAVTSTARPDGLGDLSASGRIDAAAALADAAN